MYSLEVDVAAPKDPLYSDLDLSLAKNPMSGDVVPVLDEAAVRRCIKRIIQIRRFDIPFEPDKSVYIEEFLFDPATLTTAAAIKDRVAFALNKMEPRATYEVEVNPRTVELGNEPQGYDIEVRYTVKSLMVNGNIQHFLERVR